LPQDFEGGSFELGKFVEEEHAIVGQADFAGTGIGRASDEPDIGDGVMGGAEGAAADEAFPRRDQPGDTVDAGGFDGFFEGKGREDGGEPFGQHAFSRTGISDEQDVMRTGGRDFQGPFDTFLAFDIGEVEIA
jgi:hypothetical protein